MKLRVLAGLLAGLTAYLAAVITGLARGLPLSSVLQKGVKSLLVFAAAGMLVLFIIQKTAGKSRREKAEPAGGGKTGEEEEGAPQKRKDRGREDKEKFTDDGSRIGAGKAGEDSSSKTGKKAAEEAAKGDNTGEGQSGTAETEDFQPLDLTVLEVEGE